MAGDSLKARCGFTLRKADLTSVRRCVHLSFHPASEGVMQH